MLFAGVLVIAAVTNLALADPQASIQYMAIAAILVAVAGATYDIVIDAYRIEILRPEQLGTGAGMSQYGWRIGSAGAAALALVVAGARGWHVGLSRDAGVRAAGDDHRAGAGRTGAACGAQRASRSRRGLGILRRPVRGVFPPPRGLAGARLHPGAQDRRHAFAAHRAPAVQRPGLHAMTRSPPGTSASGSGLTSIGIFIGGALYERLGLKRSVLLALVLMGVSNFSFALLAAAGHSNLGLAAAIGFENAASGYGGVVVVAYFSALANLQFTAAQYALISAAASVVGRLVTGTTAGTDDRGTGLRQLLRVDGGGRAAGHPAASGT